MATLSALLWIGCIPVFVDVEPESFCLSPDLLRRRLRENPDIAGVLPVHAYGLACDVDGLDSVCREHGIPLVYDAAQAFGSRYKGKASLIMATTAFAASTPPRSFIPRKGAASSPAGRKICRIFPLPAPLVTSTTIITALASTAS